MDYRVAVVIQPKNTTDLAGTLIFGEKIKDLGVVLCMVTPEHDILPFGDNDQKEIDKRINNIITEGDLTPEENEHIHNTPDIPNFDLSGYPSIMIIKKGGESFVQNDIEKYVATFNNIIEDVEPYVIHTKYKGVDRIQIPYMTDEVVFWRFKEDIYGESKYHSLEEQIRYLLDCICQEYSNDTERFISIVNKFYACGCDPKVQNWHKSNLDMINRDDKLIRLFGELSERRNNIENIEETLNRLSSDITDGCYVQKMDLYKNNDGFVNIKIYSNFKFPRVRGIVLGYDGSNICTARFDCTSANGIPLFVYVDTWIGNKDNPPIIIAPETSDYTMTIDSRQRFYLITDIPECVYEVLDEYRLDLQEVQSVPLTTTYNGDFIKNIKDNFIYNIGKDTVVAHKISIVGNLEEDYQESYIENYRVNHILPQVINDIDDEYMRIIGDMKDINPDQRINFKIYDEYDNSRVIMDRTMRYSEYISMAGGLPFTYPKVYNNGIDYTVETKFVKANGDIIPNTQVYSLRTSVPRSDKASIITEDFEDTKKEVHVKKSNNTMYAVGTVLKMRIYNAYGDTYNNTISVDDDMYNKGYVIFSLADDLRDNITIEIEVKEENKFQTLKQTFNIDMNKILPRTYFDVTDISIWNNDFYINRNVFNDQLNADNTYFNSMWYTTISKLYSEYPSDFGLNLKSGAPKIEIITKIKGHPLLEGLEWTTTYTREINEINTNGIINNIITISNITINSLPYNLYYDRYLRYNEFDQDGINSFRAVCNDLIIPYGGMYEFTIKTYDVFGNERKSINYTVDTVINSKMKSNSLDTNDIFDALFEYEASEDNMITKLKLDAGTKYAGMECILMMDYDDNKPSSDTKLYNFYINDQGKITQTADINYDSLNRDATSYVLYTKDDLQTMITKQNVILWIRPRNKDNNIFSEWYSGNSINNTYYRIEHNIIRPVPKEIGFINMNSSVNLSAFIDYVDDEYIETKFTHNIPNKDLEKYTCKIEIFDKDTNKSINFSESDLKSWQNKGNRAVFEKLKFEKEVNNYKIIGTISKIDDTSYNTSNRTKENEVVVKRTKQPWFDKDALLNNVFNTVDIRVADGKSYPINTRFWLRIENDDEETVMFEYNGSVSAEDIYKGYHHIHINKPLTGVYTISVIAKEPDKYQSLIYRSSINFKDTEYKYGVIYYDNDKELTNFRYIANNTINNHTVKHIKDLVRRKFPGRSILKAEIYSGTAVETTVTNINDLVGKITPKECSIKLTLEVIPEGEIRYMTMYVNGIESGTCVVRNGIAEYNDWVEDYLYTYDKYSLLNNPIEITEHKDGIEDVVNNYPNIRSINKLLDMSKTKIGKLNNVELRPLYINIKFKIDDTTHGNYTDQAKRLPEYDTDNDVFNYNVTNLDEFPDNMLNNIVSYMKGIVQTDNRYEVYSITADNKEIWNFDDTHNKTLWKSVMRNNVVFHINIANVNGIKINLIVNDSIGVNHNEHMYIKAGVGSVLHEGKLNGLFAYVESRYNISGSGIPKITKNADDCKIEMFYKKDDDSFADISEDYKLDSIFNRCSDHTIEENRQTYYPSKPAIDGFTVDKEEYTFKFNISAAENDTGIKDKNLRHHTIVKIKMVHGKMKLVNFPNGKAYNVATKKLVSTTDILDEIYLFIPNGKSIADMFDISKVSVDSGYYKDNIIANYNGNAYTAEDSTFEPMYNTTMTYQNNNINTLIISFSNQELINVFITKIEATRRMAELPRFYNHESKCEYGNIFYPIELTNAEKTVRDKVADIIISTPALLDALNSINNSRLYHNTKYLTKDNMWNVLEYPTICPKNIMLDINIYFNKPYKRAKYKSGIGEAHTAEEVANKVTDSMNKYFKNIPYTNLYPDKRDFSDRVPEIINKEPINNNFNNAIEIDDKHLKISKVLFNSDINNIIENNITNVDYVTLADYIVAYNVHFNSIISRDTTIGDNYKLYTNDITKKSLAIKDTIRGADYRNSMGNSVVFYEVFEAAMIIRNKIKWHPMNYYIAMSLGYYNPYSFKITYKPIGSTLGIEDDFMIIDNKKYIMKLEDLYNNGDILDLNNMLQVVNNDDKYYKPIDKTIVEYNSSRELYNKLLTQLGSNPYSKVSSLISEPVVWSDHEHSEGTYVFNNAIYTVKDGDTRDNNFTDATYNSNYLYQYLVNEMIRLDIGVGQPVMRPLGLLTTDIPHSKGGFGLSQNSPENQPNIISNSILFGVRHNYGLAPQYTQHASGIIQDSSDELELVVRVEDTYTDEDVIDVSDYDYKIYHVNEPESVLYDGFGLNIILEPLDANKKQNKNISILGMCKIELIPRKISDLVIDEYMLNSNMNIDADTIIYISNNLQDTMKSDYEYKYDQYVELVGEFKEGGMKLDLQNCKLKKCILGLNDNISKGMMQVARKPLGPEYMYKNTLRTYEVRLSIVCSAGRVEKPFKYYILYNYKEDTLHYPLSQNSSPRGTWNNSYEFSSAMPAEMDIFSTKYPFKNLFTRSYEYPIDKMFKYKTDINTFTIKLKKFLVGDVYNYLPTEIVGHNADKYGYKYPKIGKFIDRVDPVSHTMLSYSIDANMPWNKENAVFDINELNAIGNKANMYGIMINLPLIDKDKAKAFRSWYRRFSYVLKAPDNSYFLDTSFASQRINTYDPLIGNVTVTQHVDTKGNSYRVINYSNDELASEARAEQRMPGNLLGKVPYDLYCLNKAAYKFPTVNTTDEYKQILFTNIVLALYIYELDGHFKTREYDNVRQSIEWWLNAEQGTRVQEDRIINMTPNTDRYEAFRYIDFDIYHWSRIFVRNIFKNFFDSYNTYIDPKEGNTKPIDLFDKNSNVPWVRSVSLLDYNDYEHLDLDEIIAEQALDTGIMPNKTKEIVLTADLDNMSNPSPNKPNIIAKTKIGNKVKVLLEMDAATWSYYCVDYINPSLVTISQPITKFLERYVTVIEAELPNNDSKLAIGSWLDGYDLSRPTYIKLGDSGYISETEFNNLADSKKYVPSIIIGWYKPGIDDHFNRYTKNPKKSGLYLKTDTLLTKYENNKYDHTSLEFYYPLFRTIGENVNRKLDVLYKNEVLHARTSDSIEIILINGASFYPNPLLDYILTIIDNKNPSRILRFY